MSIGNAIEGIGTGLGLIGGAVGRSDQEQAQQQATAQRLKEEQLSAQERGVTRTQQLNEIMASQLADEGASGFTTTSPSFTALGDASFNKFAADENADALNINFDQISAGISDQNAQNTEIWGDAGGVASAGKAAYNGNFFDSSRAAPQAFAGAATEGADPGVE